MERTPEMLWDDVLVMLKMNERVKGFGINPVLYALQDYCSASGKDLAIIDTRFATSCLKWCNHPPAIYFKDNHQHTMEVKDLEEAKKQAIHISEKGYAFVPFSVGINHCKLGPVVPDYVYPYNPTQCRGYNLSLIDPNK